MWKHLPARRRSTPPCRGPLLKTLPPVCSDISDLYSFPFSSAFLHHAFHFIRGHKDIHSALRILPDFRAAEGIVVSEAAPQAESSLPSFEELIANLGEATETSEDGWAWYEDSKTLVFTAV